MRLSDQEFKRLKELQKLDKAGKLSSKDKQEYAELSKRWKDKSDTKGKSFAPGNDFSWWNKHPELTRDSATFKSNYIPGTPIDAATITYIVPGVLEIGLRTCYGPSVKATDPVNIWARNTYLKMFQKYRPASGYSASDLGIAELAGLEAIKLIASYERIYGVINRYSVLNINMPDTEAAALGLSTAQLAYLQAHLSDFRYDLNMLIKRAQRLCIPKDMSFVADAISLFGFEYIDHENLRGQIIVFTLGNYGVYSDTDLSSGGSIQFSPDLPYDYFDFTADNMCKALETVLNALLGSDSIQRIYADLVVWFGQENMLNFLPMPEDYVVAPVKSDSILHKIHNLECAASTHSSGDGTNMALTSWADATLPTADQNAVLNGYYHVYQVDDRIITVGAIKDNNAGTRVNYTFNGMTGAILEGTTDVRGLGSAHMVDGYNIEVTPEFMIEGVLFKNWCETTSTTAKSSVIKSCVAYLPFVLRLHTTGSNTPYSAGNFSLNGQAAGIAGNLALVDWAPLTYNISGVNRAVNVYGDLDVIIPVSANELIKLQRTCVLSGLTTELVVKSN